MIPAMIRRPTNARWGTRKAVAAHAHSPLHRLKIDQRMVAFGAAAVLALLAFVAIQVFGDPGAALEFRLTVD